jgi:hypothetical protein
MLYAAMRHTRRSEVCTLFGDSTATMLRDRGLLPYAQSAVILHGWYLVSYVGDSRERWALLSASEVEGTYGA